MVMKMFLMMSFYCGFVAAGCSINEQGFGVEAKQYLSSGGRMVMLKSKGLHFTTLEKGLSVTLGAAEQYYFYERKGAAGGVDSGVGGVGGVGGVDVAKLLAKAKLEEVVAEDRAKDFGKLGIPLAIVEHKQGVTVHATPVGIGIQFGVNQRSMVRMPRGFDGVLYIKYVAGKPHETHFNVRR